MICRLRRIVLCLPVMSSRECSHSQNRPPPANFTLYSLRISTKSERHPPPAGFPSYFSKGNIRMPNIPHLKSAPSGGFPLGNPLWKSQEYGKSPPAALPLKFRKGNIPLSKLFCLCWIPLLCPKNVSQARWPVPDILLVLGSCRTLLAADHEASGPIIRFTAVENCRHCSLLRSSTSTPTSVRE